MRTLKLVFINISALNDSLSRRCSLSILFNNIHKIFLLNSEYLVLDTYSTMYSGYFWVQERFNISWFLESVFTFAHLLYPLSTTWLIRVGLHLFFILLVSVLNERRFFVVLWRFNNPKIMTFYFTLPNVHNINVIMDIR